MPASGGRARSPHREHDLRVVEVPRRTRSRSAARTPRRSARACRRRRRPAARGRARSCPSRCDSQKSRTYCLSNDGGGPPGSYSSAGQKRDESGVIISSMSDDRPSVVDAELELRVGEDDAARARRARRAQLVERERRSARRSLVALRARRARPPRSASMFTSWPVVGLRRGREDRLGQPLGLAQPAGSAMPATVPRLAVVLPPRADEVAAHDALERAASSSRPALASSGPSVGSPRTWFGHDVARLRRTRTPTAR